MLPGVPALMLPPGLNALNSAVDTATIITADVGTVRRLFNAPKWGLYLKGRPVITADSVSSVEYRNESRISNYPQEAGAFQSYNKVALPFYARVMMNKGGTEAERAMFLAAVQAAAESLDVYDVVTPEITYTGANIERYDYRRTSRNGAGLVSVDIWLTEVRSGAQSTLSVSAAPSGSGFFQNGTVQPLNPTAAQVEFASRAY